jgi:hypothetical protein
MIGGLTIFDRSPAAKAKIAVTLLATTEASIGKLEAQRAAVLVGENIEDIRDLERQLGELRTSAETYRARIAAQGTEQLRLDHEARKAAAFDAIDKTVVPAVAEIERLAGKFQSDLMNLLDLYQRIIKSRDDLMVNWPAAASRPQFSSLYLTALGPQLFGHARNGTRGSGMAFVQNVRFHANTIAADVAKEAASFIEDARRTKIPKPESDNDEEAA